MRRDFSSGAWRRKPKLTRDANLQARPSLSRAKSLRIDSFFDCSPRELMRRGLLRAYRAGGGPGTKLLWKPAAREIAREGQQAFPGFRLENVNPHGSTFCGDGGMQTVPPRRVKQAPLCVIRSTCTIFAVRHGNGGDAEADRRTERQAK